MGGLFELPIKGVSDTDEWFVAELRRLRAINDDLLAAAKVALPILFDFRQNAEEYEALDNAIDALQTAIALAAEQA